MKVRPVVRKVTKWGAPVMALVCAWLWYGSNVRVLILAGPAGTSAVIQGGRLYFERETDPLSVADRPMTGVQEFYGDYLWWFDADGSRSRKWIAVPLWVCVVALAGLGLLAWRYDVIARRRARSGLCGKCGYERAGLPPNAPCPECGAPAPGR